MTYQIDINDYDGCTVDQRFINASSRSEAEETAEEIRRRVYGQFIYVSEATKKA